MYMTLMFMFTLMTVTVMIMMMMNMITKKSMISKEKLSPFECGFNPMANKRMPFSISFFLVATIFLIFDIEIIIIVPMIMTLKSSIFVSWMKTTILILTILIMGLYYEWMNGMLEWTK